MKIDDAPIHPTTEMYEQARDAFTVDDTDLDGMSILVHLTITVAVGLAAERGWKVPYPEPWPGDNGDWDVLMSEANAAVLALIEAGALRREDFVCEDVDALGGVVRRI